MDARENQLNPRRFDRDDYATPPAPGRGYTAVDSDNPDVIKSRIDRTRAEMDETVDALQHKLSLDHLIDRTLGSFRDSAGRSRALEIVRENPIPAALIGIGLTWLLVDQSGFGSRARHAPRRAPDQVGGGRDSDWLAPGAEYYERRSGPGMMEKAGEKISDLSDRAKGGAADIAGRVREGVSNLTDRVRGAVGGVGDQLSDTGHGVRDRVGHMAHDAGERVSHFAHDARQRAVHMGQDLRHRADDARRGFWSAYEDNPLMIGAGAFALGLILGVAVPTTRAENKVMGEASDELARRARKLGEQAVETTERIATKATEAAKDAAKRQDHGNFADKAAAAVTTAASTVQEEARKEGENLAHRTGIDKLGVGGDTSIGKAGGDSAGTRQKQDLNKPGATPAKKPGEGFRSDL